jgi:Rps23 Pro-64 3,4-dihydroxylase Tpa1-like proline 4-hydroxylase
MISMALLGYRQHLTNRLKLYHKLTKNTHESSTHSIHPQQNTATLVRVLTSSEEFV